MSEERHRAEACATKMIRTGSILFAIVTLLASGVIAMAATMPPELADASARGTMVSLQTWRPDVDSDTPLTSAIIAPADQTAQPQQSVLVIYQGPRRIFSLSSERTPISMFTLGEIGNLATIWEAGDGTYILCIFAYENGKVRKVLEGSSKLMPEFVYAPTPPGSLLVDSNQPVPGGYWSERVIIANRDWVHDPKTGASEYLPVSADIFNWDGKRYQVRENVKWTDRLK